MVPPDLDVCDAANVVSATVGALVVVAAWDAEVDAASITTVEAVMLATFAEPGVAQGISMAPLAESDAPQALHSYPYIVGWTFKSCGHHGVVVWTLSKRNGQSIERSW